MQAQQAQQAEEVGGASEEVEDWQGSLSSRRPKTPRCDGGCSPGPSPNARSRKIRKGARDKDGEEGQVLILPCSMSGWMCSCRA